MSWEMTLAVMLAITAGAAVFVAWPLLFGRTEPEEFFGPETSEPVLQRLLLQQETLGAAMKDLQFDLTVGSLPKEDFEQLQERYQKKAALVAERIEALKAGKLRGRALQALEEEGQLEEEPLPVPAPPPVRRRAVDLDVEEEIQDFRRRAKEIEGRGSRVTSPAPRSAGMALSCPSCGKAVKDSEARFCPHCGASLRKRK